MSLQSGKRPKFHILLRQENHALAWARTYAA